MKKKLKANTYSQMQILKRLKYCSDVYLGEYGGSMIIYTHDLKLYKHYWAYSYYYQLSQVMRYCGYRYDCTNMIYTSKEQQVYYDEVMSVEADKNYGMPDYYYKLMSKPIFDMNKLTVK